jgi:hypothetical protein
VLELNGDADVPLFAATTVRTTGTDVRFEQDEAGHMVAMIIANADGNRSAVRGADELYSIRTLEKGSAARVSCAQRVGPAS